MFKQHDIPTNQPTNQRENHANGECSLIHHLSRGGSGRDTVY